MFFLYEIDILQLKTCNICEQCRVDTHKASLMAEETLLTDTAKIDSVSMHSNVHNGALSCH